MDGVEGGSAKLGLLLLLIYNTRNRIVNDIAGSMSGRERCLKVAKGVCTTIRWALWC